MTCEVCGSPFEGSHFSDCRAFSGFPLIPQIIEDAFIAGLIHSRMNARAAEQATLDAKAFGAGYLRVLPDGSFEYIPVEAVAIDTNKLQRAALSTSRNHNRS